MRRDASGSSPLARGTPRPDDGPAPAAWLIPARAGNTYRAAGRSRRNSAHPRSRGEHEGDGIKVDFAVGSSPLARGTQVAKTLRTAASRLIPARAGNTHSTKPASVSVAAHPRSRGEHLTSAPFSIDESGSSPLARGTRSRTTARVSPVRLIPARAGNTRDFSRF